ncbi:MAG: hypothetical protein KAT43_01515 [Nanoarchaeota archaeon]|nr:hypothetical protein [Nanoarchaeota archaeon]
MITIKKTIFITGIILLFLLSSFAQAETRSLGQSMMSGDPVICDFDIDSQEFLLFARNNMARIETWRTIDFVNTKTISIYRYNKVYKWTEPGLREGSVIDVSTIRDLMIDRSVAPKKYGYYSKGYLIENANNADCRLSSFGNHMFQLPENYAWKDLSKRYWQMNGIDRYPTLRMSFR